VTLSPSAKNQQQPCKQIHLCDPKRFLKMLRILSRTFNRFVTALCQNFKSVVLPLRKSAYGG
jgi:hypothetical protein